MLSEGDGSRGWCHLTIERMVPMVSSNECQRSKRFIRIHLQKWIYFDCCNQLLTNEVKKWFDCRSARRRKQLYTICAFSKNSCMWPRNRRISHTPSPSRPPQQPHRAMRVLWSSSPQPDGSLTDPEFGDKCLLVGMRRDLKRRKTSLNLALRLFSWFSIPFLFAHKI